MADVKWIKITTDIFDDEKILLIESLPDSYAIIAVWFKLLCLAGKQNNSGVFLLGQIAYTDKMLATIFRMKESTVTMALQTFEQFGMVEIIDGVITIPNWGKHQNLDQLESKKEYMRNYMQEYRAKQKALTETIDGKSSRKTNSKTNVSEADKEIEEDIERDSIINTMCDSDECARRESTPTKAQINTFFESIWNLYPVKKGKGQVSDPKRKALFTIGFDEMQRAINRYLQELKRDEEWRKPQNGSTFFNSGYVDYLDGNFVPDEKQATPKGKAQKQFENSAKSYDLEAYERMLYAAENPPKTAGEDENIRRRAEQLRAQFAK